MKRFLSAWNRKGFTLVEMMIASAISLVVFGAMLVVFNAGRATYYTTEAKATIRDDTRQIIETLTQDLQDANLREWCFDGVGNSCPGGPNGLALNLRFQRPLSAALFYTPGTNTINWEDPAVNVIYKDIAYKWERGAAPTTPNPLYRCSPAVTVPPAAGCRVVANRVSALSLTPIPATGPPYISPIPPYTGIRPMGVDIDMTITPATIGGSAYSTPIRTQSRIVLRNPQP